MPCCFPFSGIQSFTSLLLWVHHKTHALSGLSLPLYSSLQWYILSSSSWRPEAMSCLLFPWRYANTSSAKLNLSPRALQLIGGDAHCIDIKENRWEGWALWYTLGDLFDIRNPRAYSESHFPLRHRVTYSYDQVWINLHVNEGGHEYFVGHPIIGILQV